MKNLILLLTICLLSASVFAQPDPRRVPPHSRPKLLPVAETSTETVYIPLDPAAVPCQMTVADAPNINGVKLGLTADELSKAFKIKIIPGAPNQLEVSTFLIGEQNKSALPKGINAINLAFFNNRLFYAVSAFDNVSPKKTLDNFALALSEKYDFSKAWFRTAVVNYVYLFCPRELRFTINNSNEDVFQLGLLDLKADIQITQKRKQNNSSKPQ